MALDSPTPLVTLDQMKAGQFADLVKDYTDQNLLAILGEATRACEGICNRRLAPFTLTESHRLMGVDPDEMGDGTVVPSTVAGIAGLSYSSALGATGASQVRHLWLNEYGPVYPDMWTYSNVAVTILPTYGGTVTVTADQITGPEPDTGHVWLQLGLLAPVGSWARATYSGGYTTIPADMVRAGKALAASLILQEIDPVAANSQHDAGELEALAERLLAPYVRG
jgi:hypothetical protein